MKNFQVLMLAAATLSPFLFSGAVNAGGIGGVNWKRHEHPFTNIGSNTYSQSTGDNKCFAEWANHPVVQTWSNSLEISGEPGGVGAGWTISRATNVKQTYKGNVSNPWHVWYHRSSGFCVANK